jgi:nitrate/TMAO reductase-like tetraheme cytochrome c subunit
MTIEERREKVRLRNIKWRKNNPQGYLQAAAKYRGKNPDKLRNYRWKSRYNITPERYDEMVKIQNNRCAICGNEESAKHNTTKKVQKLAVDHCHSTGKVRGLLCLDCNRGLGKFHDDIQRLENAIKYLKAYQSS